MEMMLNGRKANSPDENAQDEILSLSVPEC